MNKKELWKKFISTGRVSDYIEYKKARDREAVSALFDNEVTTEFAEEFISNFDNDFPAMDSKTANIIYEEYSDNDN